MFAGSGITDNSTQTSDRTRHITRQISEFHRMRRPRAVYVAGCRRARGGAR